MELEVLVEKHNCLDELVKERRLSDQTALKLQAAVYEERIRGVEHAVGELRRLVYIGVGIVFAVNVLGIAFMKFLK